MTKKFLLTHRRAVGDTVVMTALVRDLKITYPNAEIAVYTNYREVWENNPHIVTAGHSDIEGFQRIVLCYSKSINLAEKGNRNHFLTAFHQDFTDKSGIDVSLLHPTPDLHLSPEELISPINGRYWVVLAGGKSDVTVKHWDYSWYQQTVDLLGAYGISCIQAGAIDKGHTHPPINGALNLVGQTNLRSFMRLIYHADGVICPVTAAMHIAAAFNKPAVVIAGGRETWWWEAYHPSNHGLGSNHERIRVPHAFLHTIGLLHCCQTKGCWKALVLPTDPSDYTERRMKTMCQDVIKEPGRQPLPHCMQMITPAHVVSEVLMYYEKGILPPIGQPRALPPLPDANHAVHQSTPLASPPLLPSDAENAQAASPADASPVCPAQVSGLAQNETASNGSGGHVLAVTDLRLVQTKPRVNAIKLTIPAQAVVDQAASIFDHSAIGGRFTICVMAYGNYPHLIKRCLGSILDTIPRERLDIRIGANACCEETLEYIRSDVVGATKIYEHPKNAFKYPVMREMFHDADCPIQTNYLVWFDDDSYVVKTSWLQDLSAAIIENHNHKVGMYGIKFIHDIKHFARDGHDPRHWFQQATWWQSRPFQTSTGGEAPNATAIHFVSGGWWAIYTPLIKMADIPDSRLRNNGDMQLGAACHQFGYKIRDFNRNKTHVHSSGAGRRGVQHNFPWSHEQPYEKLLS